MWTLVGAGIKTTKQSSRDQSQCVPKGATWLKSRVEGFEPEKNSVTLFGTSEEEQEKKVNYPYTLDPVLTFSKFPSLIFNELLNDVTGGRGWLSSLLLFEK
jgi:hypothetical protein